MWTDSLLHEADAFTEELQSVSTGSWNVTPVDEDEVEQAASAMKSGQACGRDGVPPEVVKKFSCLVGLLALLFTVMVRHAVYPASWGIALIRSLVKTGKPKHLASSLRGIRLRNAFACCFGRVLDSRA